MKQIFILYGAKIHFLSSIQFAPIFIYWIAICLFPFQHVYKCTWGRFHQYWRQTFLRAQNEKLFWCTNLANGAQIWQTAHNFCCLNSANAVHILMLNLLVKLNGNFFAERCALSSFCLANKVW